jgi:hypothetical protein
VRPHSRTDAIIAAAPFGAVFLLCQLDDGVRASDTVFDCAVYCPDRTEATFVLTDTDSLDSAAIITELSLDSLQFVREGVFRIDDTTYQGITEAIELGDVMRLSEAECQDTETVAAAADDDENPPAANPPAAEAAISSTRSRSRKKARR